MNMFSGAYRDRRVLLTGHTGFKGSWLALWLSRLGASFTGISLPPETKPNHWELLNLPMDSRYIDICDARAVQKAFVEIKPEVVFHLGAQALVRKSYDDPLATWETNVLGTANILEACRNTPSVKAIIVVTTDKCYENREWIWGYRENDSLGGHDPYSASKAAAELVVQSYRRSFFLQADSPFLATARAGNVIGGGDWAADRLIPDLIRSVHASKTLEIRSPNATRPWQHVLESLSGYLLLGQALINGKREFSDAWNFGPDITGNRSVSWVLNYMKTEWGALNWEVEESAQLHEATLLYLDSTKARQKLGWTPVWTIETGLSKTAQWYRRFMEGNSVISDQQLDEYLRDATDKELIWATSK